VEHPVLIGRAPLPRKPAQPNAVAGNKVEADIVLVRIDEWLPLRNANCLRRGQRQPQLLIIIKQQVSDKNSDRAPQANKMPKQP
jgi:hypothetical protein